MSRAETIKRKVGSSRGVSRSKASGSSIPQANTQSVDYQAPLSEIAKFSPDIPESEIRKLATENIKKSHPELFSTRQEIRQMNLPGLLRQFNILPEDYGRALDNASVGRTIQVNKELGYLVDRTYQRNQERKQDLVNQEYRRLYLNATRRTGEREREKTLQSQADLKAKKDELAAKERKAAAIKSASARGEREAEFTVKNDPELREKFGAIQTIFKAMEEEAPEKREQLMKQLQEQANALVDTSFEKDKSSINEALNLKLRQLNDQFKLFSDQQQFELERTISSIDRVSAETLSDTLESLAGRGLLDSGMLRRIANEVVEKREIGVSEAQKIADFGLRGERQKLQFSTDAANLQARRAIFGTEQDQEFSRISRFMDLLELNNDQLMLLEEISGAKLPEGVGTEEKTIGRRTFQLPPKTEAASRKPSSLNLARKFQAEGTPIAQQVKEREAFLKSAAQQPSQTRSSAIPSSALSSKSTMAGRAVARGAARAGQSTMTSRAVARGAARASPKL
jgi:hypothetical protein